MNKLMLSPLLSLVLVLVLVLVLALGCPAIAQVQVTPAAAKAEGKAFGELAAAAAQRAATTVPSAERVPGYGGTPSQSDYFNDPERMSREAANAAASSTGYQTMRQSINRRAKFNRVDLDAAIARAKTINQDPLVFTSGMAVGGTAGRCIPLPPSASSAGRYFATCNTGYTLERSAASCTVALSALVTVVTDYLYYCSKLNAECTAFQTPTCTQTGSHRGPCLQGYRNETGLFRCIEPGDPIAEYTCSQPVAGQTAIRSTSRQVLTTSKDESPCASLAADSACTAPTETCTDSDPVTRSIAGYPVTQPCWAWRRDYQCSRYTPAQDCTELETNPGCTLKQEYCITGETPCRTFERVYDCPVPEQIQDSAQFICDGDIYCIDGSCETIGRQPNTEFKDAVVALNGMDQARREFDPANLTLFKGSRESCSSKVFGVLNCCKGKGFPLIPGIQLLVALGCSKAELQLHEKDAKGLCAYVGTYCASSFLGVCLTKRKVYCCFESKLSRILQEQGRAQLNKPWAAPKTETCAGFTIDEFARLDLSQMDFSEVYAEFTQAARLPDELQAATEIQQKIEDYYARAAH